jgi:hypothetical protein
MKLFHIARFSVASFALAATASGQGFVNLDFEHATIIQDPSNPGSVYAFAALPGWSPYIGTNQVTDVLYNNFTLGNASIDIAGQAVGAIDGLYSVVLQPGRDPFGSDRYIGVSISQSSLVPVLARSLQFKFFAHAFPSPDFYVSLGGRELSLTALTTGPGYTLYGADITPFAGQVASLTIGAAAQQNIAPYYFDSIEFSSSSIPEPSMSSIMLICALVFGCRINRPRPRSGAGVDR